ncbi:hypothetical protein Tco_0646577, partial [Tanacetum coccineum]
DPMDINKMMDTLEPEETGVGGLQLPGKDRVMTDTLELEETGVGGLQLPGKDRVVSGRLRGNRYSTSCNCKSELKDPLKFLDQSIFMIGIYRDEDVEKSYFADQETMEVGVSGSHEIKAEKNQITEEERSARYACTSHAEVTCLFEIMFLILLT